MRRSPILALLGLGAIACATTRTDSGPAPATWHAPAAPAAGGPLLAPGARLDVYVAGFGLSDSVAKRYPELIAGQVGFGIANRLVEGLYESGRFTFREEKAEVVERTADLLRGHRAAADPGAAGLPDVRWLLYGEVVDLRTARRESVRGFKTENEVETEVTLQIRLLDRRSHTFHPATASGTQRSPQPVQAAVTAGGSPPPASGARAAAAEGTDALDPAAVAAATDQAVARAVAQLVAELTKP
jgi:hypothetical protein